MVAVVSSLFKPDQHETPQKRKMKDKYNHVIQVVILIFFRDLQWIKFIFQGSNRIGRLTGTVHIHNKGMADEKMSVGASLDFKSAAFDTVRELLKEITEKALENVEAEQVKEGGLGVVDEEDTLELFAIGTLTNNPLRLRGGAGKDDSDDDEQRMMPPPAKKLNRRTKLSKKDSDQPYLRSCFEKSCQRPAPLDPPRQQDLEYGNMTTDVVENEDGSEIFSPCLDSYRRTETQVQSVKDAGEDQRKVGGGVYENKDDHQQFLTIQKGWATKNIGLKLTIQEEGHMRTKLNCFAIMEYEFFKFDYVTPGRRIRQKRPQETRTGFVWNGFGGDLAPEAGMSRVYAYCERAGERDLHFSELGCERMSEAPGASQEMCSNRGCGQVKWHLSQKEFQYNENEQWEEIQQNDFALVVFGNDKEELVWTEQPSVGQTVRSRWARLEDSPQFDGVPVDAGTKERITNFLNQHHLPPFMFQVPRYEPVVQRWQDQEALRRQPAACER